MSDETPRHDDAGPPELPPPSWSQPPEPFPPAAPDPYAQDPYAQDPYALGGETLVVAPRRRRGVLVGAVAAALALVAGAGIYVATQLSGGGLQPEALAPSSTFAFAKVDLDPAASQKIAVHEFAAHFPSAPKVPADDIFDALVADLLDSDDEIDYARDVKPWLGKRVGVAGFFDARSRPQAIGILQVTDEDAARAGLQRLAAKDPDSSAYRVTRGYAVIGDDQAVVDQAVAAAERESFAGHEQYAADLDRLDGDQVITAWADLDAVFRAARSAVPRLGALPNALTSQQGGRLVAGAHAANDYVEVEGYSLGAAAAEQLTNSPPKLLTSLPASTLAAASVNDLQAQAEKFYSQLTGMGLDPKELLGEFEASTGLKLREEIFPLLGKQAALALGSLPVDPLDPTTAKAGFISEVTDPTKAQAVGRKLVALAERLAGVPLASEVKGSTFYLTLGQGYAGQLKAGGDLGSSPTFRKAMGDLGDEVVAAMYVDIAGMVDALPEEMSADDADLKALRAFGAAAGRKGDTAYFRMRLVVR